MRLDGRCCERTREAKKRVQPRYSLLGMQVAQVEVQKTIIGVALGNKYSSSDGFIHEILYKSAELSKLERVRRLPKLSLSISSQPGIELWSASHPATQRPSHPAT